MTPKEKALELIKKFDPIVYPYLGSGFMTNTEDEDVILKNAKKCAVIAVDEIIKYHELLFDKGFRDVHIALSSPIKTYLDIMNPMLKYLQEIKQEIEKL